MTLGKHRLVVLDTGWDAGVPPDTDFDRVVAYLFEGLPNETKTLLAGGTPSVGIRSNGLNAVKKALADAGTDGIVIVGMHHPAFQPPIHEYPFFLRETLHPTKTRASCRGTWRGRI